MGSRWDAPVRHLGVAEDETREQFSATIRQHPGGGPSPIYLGKVIANARADTLAELQALIADFARKATDA